ncbi:MAG: amidohydrolase family protein [Oscillospiraceae bacterium]|nr:amidohydrolase family protein [Oscillospiraceae bacterium]
MILDFHVHAFPDRIAEHAIAALAQNSGYVPEANGTFADTAQKLKESGTDRFVLLNVAQTPKQQKNANSFVIEHHGGNVISFAAIHPLSEDALYELDRAMDAGLKGVKLHPEYQGFFIDDPTVYPFYEACAKRGIVMLFHAGYDCAYPDSRRGYPDRSSKVVKDFSGAKIVLAHLGNCLDNQETLEQLCGLDCYLDLAICYKTMSDEKIKAVIKAHSADKILYGTDFPWSNPRKTVEMIERLGLSEQEKENIYHRNAEKLLQI